MTFQQKILDRYACNKRELPRRDTFDAYKVLVSETMLQQTQVDRVIPKFTAFLQTFPTFSDLADAPKELLLYHRSGLGFNSRVLRLQQCARLLHTNYNGILPRERETLLTLPGIWPYTSCSLLAFTYNLAVPVIDTNIRRVFIHELGLSEQITTKELELIALEAIPTWHSNDWHNALMDYGSLVLTSKATGIKPRSKQSRFAWSRRQVRGNILKHLLTQWPTAITILAATYQHDAFDEIVSQMLTEGLIHQQQSIISIE